MNKRFKRMTAWVMALIMALSIVGAVPVRADDSGNDPYGSAYGYEDVLYPPLEVATPGALVYEPVVHEIIAPQPLSGALSARFHGFYLGGTPGYRLGDWYGRFGADGFILFEHGWTYQELPAGPSLGDYARNVGRNPARDVSDWPSYLTSYTVTNAEGYLGQGWPNPFNNVLERPAGVAPGQMLRAGIAQVDMNDSLEMTFNLSTTDEIIVTLYVINDVRNNWFTIRDLAGDVILDGANQLGNSYIYSYDIIDPPPGMENYWAGYISFAVSGGGFTIGFRSNRNGPGMNGVRTNYTSFNRIGGVFFDSISATDARLLESYHGTTPNYQVGEWIGRFGEDGYILFDHDWVYQDLQSGFGFNASVAVNVPRNPANDIYNLPSYITNYTVTNANAYKGQGWPGLPFALERPASSGAHRMVSGIAQTDMNDPLEMTFHLNSTIERVVTLYIIGDLRNHWFTIKDLSGDVILENVNQSSGGGFTFEAEYMYVGDHLPSVPGHYHGYISFAVSGGGFTISFRSNHDNRYNGNRVNYAAFSRIGGVFFDTVPEAVDPDWLEIDLIDGNPVLTWPDLSFFNTIILERSVVDIPGTFSQIAVINAPATQFVDLDPALIAGRQYFYRARFIWDNEMSDNSDTVDITMPMAAAQDNLTAFLGYDRSTGGGNWVGVYGSEGHIILGMRKSSFPPHIPVVDNWVSSWADLDPNYPPDINPATDHFVANMPFLDSYAVLDGNRLVFSPDYHANDNRILELPPGAPGIRRFTRLEGRPHNSVTFHINDNVPRIFTFYTVMVGAAFDAQIRDLSGNIIVSQSFEARHLIDGAFVSFMVSGSFTLYLHGAGASTSGFFFDSPLPSIPTLISAVAANPGRDITVNWAAPTAGRSVVLERSTNNINFTQIGVFGTGVTQFVDTNLTPGQTYFYRIRYAFGVNDYSVSTPPLSATVPDMAPSFVHITSPAADVQLGDTVTVTARFTRLDSTGTNLEPISGETVFFRLTGPNVGDGISVGQAIYENIGSAITDANGYATFTFVPAFAGDFGIVAFTIPNDITQVDGATSSPVGLTVAAAASIAAPTIFRVSDAVQAGGLISINGSDFNDNADLRVFIQQDTTGTTPAGVGAATQVEIIQRDRYGQFIVARMPAGATPGVYHVWVQNDIGLSAPVMMNAARALHISDYEIFPGIEITVVGRNFAGSEFGASDNVLVRLAGAGTHAADVVSFTPFSAVFTVSDSVPQGTYFVEVSNDGGNNWSRTTSGQTLTVVAGNIADDDPLNLGVAWARDFSWDNEFDVTDFGANPDPANTTNDTAFVQAAINAARDSGGGVVFFPKGDYFITTITLPSNIVLLGECREHTRLIHIGNSTNFINSAHVSDPGSLTGPVNRQGVARLTLLLSDEEMRPDAFIWLGERWGDSFGDATLREANRLFVYDVKQYYRFGSPNNPASGRGMGLLFLAHERVLIQGNYFRGHMGCIYMTAVSQYYFVRGNRFEYTRGQVHSLARYFFAEGNTLIGQTYRDASGNAVSYSMHGIMARDSSFMANNYVARMGDRTNQNNEGEAICVEVPAGYHNLGQVLGAMGTSVTVAAERPLVWPRMDYGTLSIAIVYGRGMGQLRPVASIVGSTIVVTEEFAVQPDHTSRFTLIGPNDSTTFYNNTIHDNAKGLWIFGNSFDGVIANNTSVDSEGIFVWTNGNRDSGIVPGYGTRIADNLVVGSSWRSGVGGIGFTTGRGRSDFFSTDIFGFEVINNVVVGGVNPRFNPALPNAETEAPPVSGIYAWSTLKASGFDGIDGARDAVNTIIFGNHVENLQYGIHLSRSTYGSVIMNNTYAAMGSRFLRHAYRDYLNVDFGVDGVNIFEQNNIGGSRAINAPAFAYPPFVITTCLDDAIVGELYEFILESVGDAPITWTLIGGELPLGLVLSPDGVISGTPTEYGIFTIIVQADNGTLPATRRLTIIVEP